MFAEWHGYKIKMNMRLPAVELACCATVVME